MIAAQAELPLEYSGEVEAAFADGRLYITVDDQFERTGRTLSPHLSFVARPATWDGHGKLVHVISRPAHGEIRGYVLINGLLHLRLPNYAGDWPELDAAVARRLLAGMAVSP